MDLYLMEITISRGYDSIVNNNNKRYDYSSVQWESTNSQKICVVFRNLFPLNYIYIYITLESSINLLLCRTIMEGSLKVFATCQIGLTFRRPRSRTRKKCMLFTFKLLTLKICNRASQQARNASQKKESDDRRRSKTVSSRQEKDECNDPEIQVKVQILAYFWFVLVLFLTRNSTNASTKARASQVRNQ